MEQKNKTVQITVKISEDKYEALKKYAAAKHINMADVVRGFIQKGLAVQGYEDNIDFLTGIIRQEVKAEIGLQIERLVKILMKVGIVTSSNYFLMVRLLSDFINPSIRQDFKDINTNARRQGIDYMKLKDYDVVSFMESEERVDSAVYKIKPKQEDDY